MRLATLLVIAAAVTVIVASAVSVIARDTPSRFAVSVEGLLGYVYYDRAYDITITYENQGGAVNGPVELSALLPETFALAEHIDDPERHGERLVWRLDGLGAGESGSVQIKVQGTLPADLSEAVFNLPGYVGHTAFVEGFELTVTLAAGSSTVSALAISDTGGLPPPAFSKVFIPDQIDSGDVSTLRFTIDNSGSGSPASSLDFTDNLPGGIVVATPPNDNATCTGGTLTAAGGSSVISYTGGSVAASGSCTIDVDITSSTPSMHVNLSGDLTSSLGNSGTASDTLTVVALPTPTPTPKPFVPDPDPSQFPQLGGTPVLPATATLTPEPVETPEAPISPPSTGDAGLLP